MQLQVVVRKWDKQEERLVKVLEDEVCFDIDWNSSPFVGIMFCSLVFSAEAVLLN